MGRIKVASFPHPYDLHKKRAGGGAALAKWHQGNQNQKDWRPYMAEKFDRTKPEDSIRWRATLRGDRLMGGAEGGEGWEHWAARLTPRPHRFFARMALPYAQFANLVIPDVVNKYRSQNAGAVYLVLAVGAGIETLEPGNAIVASAHSGSYKGLIGPQIRQLWTDVEYVQGDDTDNDVVRRAGGDVLAKVIQEGQAMKLVPTLDRIVVQREKSEDTERGLIVPDIAKKKSCRGKVLAVGPGRFIGSTFAEVRGVKAGDTVLFAELGGIDVRVGAEDYVVLREEEVIGVVKG